MSGLSGAKPQRFTLLVVLSDADRLELYLTHAACVVAEARNPAGRAGRGKDDAMESRKPDGGFRGIAA